MAAIKLLRAEQYKRTDLIQRFFQEARTVNQINHEHIVEISDFAQEDGPSGPTAVYCVMELLTGQSLAQRLAKQPLSLERSVHIARQVCQALAAAHKVGVVHRDVKVDNIFLIERRGDPDYVKVLDFGVAKLTASGDAQAPLISTMDGAIIGTPTAMAPEQASGGAVDHRVDVYAVGVVLYQLLSGKLPFDAENFARLVVKLMTQPPEPLPPKNPLGQSVPAPLRALVLQCLAKEREQRPASMEALEAALVAAASAPAGAAAPAPSRALRWAVGAGVLVLAGLLGVWALAERKPVEAVVPPSPVPVAAVEPAVVEPAPPVEPAPVEPVLPPIEPEPVEPVKAAPPDAGAQAPPPKPAKPVLLTKAIVIRVVQKEGRGVLDCMQRFSPMLPEGAGSIQVRWGIEKSGSVTGVEVKTRGLGKELEACMVRQVSKLKFPRNVGSADGKPTPVTLPFAYDRKAN
jgi:serine/threonine-protein kinase